jgi:hypothetical protein
MLKSDKESMIIFHMWTCITMQRIALHTRSSLGIYLAMALLEAQGCLVYNFLFLFLMPTSLLTFSQG